jgi:hypothetical protein
MNFELPRRIQPRPYTDTAFIARERARAAGTMLAPPSDTPASPCSACGAQDRPRRLNFIEGLRISLCADEHACTQAYRAGLTASAYAQLLSMGVNL